MEYQARQRVSEYPYHFPANLRLLTAAKAVNCIHTQDSNCKTRCAISSPDRVLSSPTIETISSQLVQDHINVEPTQSPLRYHHSPPAPSLLSIKQDTAYEPFKFPHHTYKNIQTPTQRNACNSTPHLLDIGQRRRLQNQCCDPRIQEEEHHRVSQWPHIFQL